MIGGLSMAAGADRNGFCKIVDAVPIGICYAGCADPKLAFSFRILLPFPFSALFVAFPLPRGFIT
jgi:hypothetical protein